MNILILLDLLQTNLVENKDMKLLNLLSRKGFDTTLISGPTNLITGEDIKSNKSRNCR